MDFRDPDGNERDVTGQKLLGLKSRELEAACKVLRSHSIQIEQGLYSASRAWEKKDRRDGWCGGRDIIGVSLVIVYST